MGEFDKIIKENIEALFLPLSEKLLGIRIVTSERIEEKLQTTIEREPDFLRLIEDDTGEKFILHLEFQTQDDPAMIYRMAEYKALLLRKLALPVRQFVLYLGRGQSKMVSTLPPGQEITGFTLKNLSEVSVDQSLNSEIPEEVLLAILGDFSRQKAEEVIHRIIRRLQALQKDEVTLMRYVQQLIVLARLRKLDSETKEITKDMPITYDIETDAFYIEGLEKGLERGLEQGLERGLEKGEDQGAAKQQRATVERMLHDGNLSIEQIAQFTGCTPDDVIAIQKDLQQ